MDILANILLIFALSIVVIYICNRLKIPTIIGLLITGFIVGPYGFGFIKTAEDVELLAKIGVIVLLFTIGLELSFDAIASLKRAIIAGVGQVLITIAVVVLLLVWFTDIAKALFYGFIVSASSTAIVLKIMDEYALTESPQGRIALAILIVQDIAIVPLMLFIPLLVGNKNISIGSELLILLGKGIVVIGLVIVLARYIIPRFLYEIARTRSRELFIISVVTLCLAITFATHSIGLSVELGAFLAGVIVAASEYSGQTFNSMVPFRDLFTSFFFISIGMLLNPATVINNVGTITGISLAIIFTKFIVIMLIIIAVGYPLRTALLSGFSLSQIGEFSFILSQIGLSYLLFQDNEYQLFLAVSIITMALTPFLIKYSEKITEKIVSLPFPNAIKFGLAHITIEYNKEILKDHIIIVGYGINGKNVAAAARSIKIPYIIIEMNPDTVKLEKRKGEHIIYGDASQEDLLHYVNVDSARVMVIAIADRSAIKRIIMLARGLSSQVHIIVRTRFVGDIKELIELGANEVIPEEYETSIEIFARVLHYYGVPRNDIEDMVQKIRSQGYAMLRQLSANTFLELPIAEIDMQPIRVCGQSPAIQKTIGQMQFRKLYKFSIVAIKRGGNIITNPGADDVILDDDILYVVGNRDAIREAVKILRMSVNLDSCDV